VAQEERRFFVPEPIPSHRENKQIIKDLNRIDNSHTLKWAPGFADYGLKRVEDARQ
jgi:hypothetical protein